MGTQHAWKTVVFVLALGALPEPVTAEEAAPRRIRIHVVADTRVPRDVAEKAKPETARIYQHIGIDLVFVDEPSADSITMRVLDRPMKDVRGTAMGVAPRGSEMGRLVYAFYDRIEGYARQHDKPISQILGHVMAHELGHLLLPYGSHSKSGLMVAAWDRQQVEQIGRGWLSFTADQAEAIRTRLSTLD